MDPERYYRASEIVSYPEIQARPAREADAANGIKARFARRYRPARRGLVPISETHFHRLRKSGKFPVPDAHVNDTPLWSSALLHDYLTSKPESE